MVLGFSKIKRWTILVISAFCLGLSLPALLGPRLSKQYLPSFMADNTLTFGLDLKGGVQLLLQVDQEKLLDDYYSSLLSRFRQALKAEQVSYAHLKAAAKGLSFQCKADFSLKKFGVTLNNIDPGLKILMLDHASYLVTLEATERDALISRARDQSIETIRRRVDETGTKEPLIQAQGQARVLLQVPGVENAERVRALVGKTARLTFHMVDQTLSLDGLHEFVPSAEQEVLLEAQEGTKNTRSGLAYVVNREVLLSGDMLVDAQPAFDEYNRPQVSFAFDGLGGDLFGEITRQNVGRLFAIVLDGRVISAPEIKGAILGGRGVIQGRFSVAEAQELSLLMRSGSLPAPLKVLEERVIGPGLGADSIQLGVLATCIAIAFVLMIIFAAYGFFGAFANAALLLNLCFLLGGMGLLGATLTLPGIAGIALTLGMAVDANVLINERIREELAAGRWIIQAIDFGYRRAMTTIIDSNLTTLIGGFLLYFFGTGPVRGFAVTLSLGIIISMLTAVILSRVFVAFWVTISRPKKLSL